MTTATEFPLDGVARGEGGLEAVERVSHLPLPSLSTFDLASSTIHSYSGSGSVNTSRNLE